MKGSTLLISVFSLLAVAFTVCDALALGFEVETPLDPFLGSLTKCKRNLLKRLRGNDCFDGINPSFFFGHPLSPGLPLQNFPQLLNTQIPPLQPLSSYQQRKQLAQVPSSVIQQFDAQLANLFQLPNQQFAKKGLPSRNMFGGQNANFLQQFTQPNMPLQFGNSLPNAQ